MGVSNLCKVFAATLLRHPDDLKTVCPPSVAVCMCMVRARHGRSIAVGAAAATGVGDSAGVTDLRPLCCTSVRCAGFESRVWAAAENSGGDAGL